MTGGFSPCTGNLHNPVQEASSLPKTKAGTASTTTILPTDLKPTLKNTKKEEAMVICKKLAKEFERNPKLFLEKAVPALKELAKEFER